jgi:hypothetical protein
VTRVAREVGTEGKLGGQAQVRGVAGVEGPDRQRQLHGVQPDRQVRNIAQVATAVAEGRPVAEDHGGRPGRDPGAEDTRQHDGRQLSSFASEVTRVAREVGSEGKLGGQARGRGVYGTWKRT